MVLWMNNLFEKYRNLALTAGYTANSKQSLDWYRKRIRKDRNIRDHDIIVEGAKNAKIQIGEMVTYRYQPLLREKLNYYDIHPLIVILEVYNDGWLGANVHYLPPAFRAKLFYEISYSINRTIVLAEQLKKNPITKPAIKRYKAEQVRTKPKAIPKEEWEIAIQLPFESFKKASIKKVWQDSRKRIWN